MARGLVSLMVFLLVVVAFGGNARADNKALAETLFLEGQALLDGGSLEEACKRFRASHQAEPSVGAILNLARCHQRQGKLASAWSEYKEAANLASVMNQPRRKKGALEYASQLAPRLSKLTVTVAAPVKGLVVTLDDTVLLPGSFGVAVPVDPGTHEVTAKAPGYTLWRQEISVAGENDVRSVTVPALLVDETAPNEIPPKSPRATELHPRAVAGLAIAAVGGASLAVGIVLGVIAVKKDDSLACDGGVCSSADYATVQAIKPIANGATATIVIGAAAILGGGILFLTAPRGYAGSTSEQAVVVALPMLSPEVQGIVIIGRF